MERIVAAAVAPWRFSMFVFSVFSLLALGFAAIGLSAVIAYAVKQRTHEIGIRVAIGARPRDVVRLMVGEGVYVVMFGLLIGVPAAVASTRVLSGLLFSVTPTDPATFGGIVAVLGVVGLLAAYLPARRAAAIDPVTALGRE
jgi:putative ABC transport system permease protein